MLDTILILIFGLAVIIYILKFNFAEPEVNFIVAAIFIFLGFSLISTGFQSSNTTLGTYTMTDVNADVSTVGYTPQTYLASPLQNQESNFDLGLSISSIMLILFGLGMIVGRNRLLH